MMTVMKNALTPAATCVSAFGPLSVLGGSPGRRRAVVRGFAAGQCSEECIVGSNVAQAPAQSRVVQPPAHAGECYGLRPLGCEPVQLVLGLSRT